jgi:hypothetical protein
MVYRRPPFSNRHTTNNITDQETEIKKPADIKETPEIPLPNESENVEDNLLDTRGHSSAFINIFNHKIFLDEIILLGLLFLLFEEGVVDEFLVIILLYILLTGRI